MTSVKNQRRVGILRVPFEGLYSRHAGHTPRLAGRHCPYSVLCSLYSSPWDVFLVSLSGSRHQLFFCLHLFIPLGTCQIQTRLFAAFARMLHHKDESILNHCLSPSRSVSPGIWAMPCLCATSTIMPWTLCARTREESWKGRCMYSTFSFQLGL